MMGKHKMEAIINEIGEAVYENVRKRIIDAQKKQESETLAQLDKRLADFERHTRLTANQLYKEEFESRIRDTIRSELKKV